MNQIKILKNGFQQVVEKIERHVKVKKLWQNTLICNTYSKNKLTTPQQTYLVLYKHYHAFSNPSTPPQNAKSVGQCKTFKFSMDTLVRASQSDRRFRVYGERECMSRFLLTYCHQILYNQLNFANVDSLLKAICNACGVFILFLPKFHCELNFIEQCWGHAKNIYQTYPESSRKDHLEENTTLESIPLSMICKFSNQSLQFMDTYDHGLNGRQAVWVSRKYCGHWVLPNDIMEELGKMGFPR